MGILIGEGPTWAEARNKGIGASEAATVLGKSPYATPRKLWLEKTGRAQGFGGNASTELGHVLEPVIIGLWQDETGLEVVHLGKSVYADDLIPYVLASPDGLPKDCDIDVLEIKATSQLWRELPLHVWIQVQQQLRVMNGEIAEVAALIRSTMFKRWRVERDDHFIDQMLEVEEEFWSSVVMDRELREEEEGKKEPAESIEIGKGMLEVLERLDEVSTTRLLLEKEEKELKGSVLAYLNENGAKEATYLGAPVVSLTTYETKRFDSKSFQADNPGLYEKYIKVSESQRLNIK